MNSRIIKLEESYAYIKKKTRILFLVLLLCLFLFHFSGTKAEAQLLDAVSQGLMGVILIFIQGIRYLAGVFMALAMWVLDTMISPEIYNEVFLSDAAKSAINEGWKLIRDFFNMFFILVLIFSSISTILRVQAYSAKKMLVGVLMAALLVNFSKPITLFVIDFSQLAMGFFMNNIGASFSSYSTTMANSMKISTSVFSLSFTEATTMMTSMIFSIIFMVIFGIMLMVLALGLVFRMIAFWVLIVLSPVAFVSMAFPGTALSGMQKTWVSKLTSWAFFGPVLLFFLWLAMDMANAVSNGFFGTNGTSGFISSLGLSANSAQDMVKELMKMIIPYSVVIYFLFYGYDLTKKIASGAGGGLGGLLDKGGKMAADWGKRSARIAGAPVLVPASMMGNKFSREFKAARGALAEKKGWRLLTEEGRKRAESEKASESKGRWGKRLGVKGSEEKEMKNRAEEYKKTKSDAELKSLAEKGDAAAAYALAESGGMGQATYDAFVAANKNQKLTKAVNSKVKQNRADLAAINKVDTMTAEEITKERKKPGRGGMTDSQIRDAVMEDEMGNLTAEKWADQNWVDIVNSINSMPAGSPGRVRIENAIRSSWTGLRRSAQAEVRKRISAAKVRALSGPPLSLPI